MEKAGKDEARASTPDVELDRARVLFRKYVPSGNSIADEVVDVRRAEDEQDGAARLVEESERVILTERDSFLVQYLLENPPPLNARMRAAIAGLPDDL